METSKHIMASTPYTLVSLKDETMAVEMSPHQNSICQEANGEFCDTITPFQLLVNLPSCITACIH